MRMICEPIKKLPETNSLPETITLRDYMAAKAMQGMIVGLPAYQDHHRVKLAESAYDMADAMLAARGGE